LTTFEKERNIMHFTGFAGEHHFAFGGGSLPLVSEHGILPWQFGTTPPAGWSQFFRPASPYVLPLEEHRGAIFGITEAGLDISLPRLAANAARAGWKVVIFDAEGSTATAALFVATMRKAGRANTFVFPNAPYDGFQGSKTALFHRLLSVGSFREPYYQHIATVALSALVQRPKPFPRCLSDLVGELTLIKRQVNTFSRDVAEVALPLTLLSTSDLLGVPLRYAAFCALSGNQLSGAWSYDEADAAYLSFSAWSRPQEARALAQYLLADLASFLVERAGGTSRVLLLVKHPEWLVETKEVAALFALLDHHRGSVFIATRSPADLGQEAGRILANATTLVVHRSATTLPFEPYVARSGPGRRPFFDGTVQRFPDARCCVICQGQVATVEVAPVQLDEADLLAANADIPPPPPDDPPPTSSYFLTNEDEEPDTLSAIFGADKASTTLEREQQSSSETSGHRHVRSVRRSRRTPKGPPPLYQEDEPLPPSE
jgi:hypothetical protein